MADYKETLLEILQRIKDTNENVKLEDPVPTQDDLLRNIVSDIIHDRGELQDYLNTLTESHHLFAIKIVEPDPNLMIDGITGYLVTEVGVVSKLQEKYKTLLETAYEHQFYQRKHYVHILKELIHQARQFNNTPFGKCLNVSHMLEQFAQIFAADFSEYSDTWKANRLEEVLSSRALSSQGSEESGAASPEAAGDPGLPPEATPEPAATMSDYGMGDSHLPDEMGQAPADVDPIDEFSAPPPTAAHEAPAASAPTGRATDNAEFMKIQEMNRSGNWGKAVDKFGVQFLLRIHFRKYEFDKVRHLLKTRKIAREEDVRFIRDTLRLMEGRTHIDPQLNYHLAKMADLRRMAQLRLNQIQLLKKK